MSKVLVVERVASVREALALVLELEGHTVETAACAEAALAQTVVWQPDVVVTDADLPDLSLAAFCTALRTAGAAPTVVVTSLRPANCTPVAACPGASFLEKPFTPAELAAVVGGTAGANARGSWTDSCTACP
jgi:DNA-binding response OmpR family regulator